MVRVPGGSFQMGTDDGRWFEGPPHRVEVESFFLDRREVENRQFAQFVEKTGYVTEAEKLGWAAVFKPEEHRWTRVEGADWRHPEGPTSSLEGREHHPVVHVSWNDARAYATWAGKRLPTEAEWEWAARAGQDETVYPWGSELAPGGEHRANTWQGPFPARDEGADGHTAIAPTGQYPKNDRGLYDMAGNVWEWTADRYAPYGKGRAGASGTTGTKTGTGRVIRGGSWLCSPSYCEGYRVAARQNNEPDAALNNLGFRCARDAD